MVFVKVQKNSAYFSRFQVQFRRRREAKTDYHARRVLIRQDKNKYSMPKYRLVVRFTNKHVIVQVARARVAGDEMVAAANSSELSNYGIKFGQKNFAAAYATGLLCARRVLAKFKLDKLYEGVTVADGELYSVEEVEDAPRPFRAYLDLGLARATTGARVFGALKGAVDGGLDVPHSEKRFPGYSKESKSFNPEVLKKYIYGGHVADYMSLLEEEDGDKYNAHFAKFIAEGVNASQLEELYKKAHEAIRANPNGFKAEKKDYASIFKRVRRSKMNLAQRRDRVRQKLASRAAADDE